MNYDIDTPEGMDNAVRWTQATFATIKDGGKWVIPRSNTIVTIDHTNKTAYVVTGDAPEFNVDRVINAMGWEVVRLSK